MAKVAATKSTVKDTSAPVAKAPAAKKAAPVKAAPKAAPKAEAPKATSLNTAPKAAPAKPAKPAPKPKKPVEIKAIEVKTPNQPAPKSGAKVTSTGKTIYHVSKRGETKADRVWKVFIQGSDKVIKLFDTQQEALDYAKQLADNKNDGSTVMLHGLDGKIRKY